MSERLLVIGGDAGGMAAASQARRRQPYMEIVALERGNRTSYSACGIPYLVGGDVADRSTTRGPHARGVPRQPPHRRPHAPRGHGHRPRRRQGRGARPRPRPHLPARLRPPPHRHRRPPRPARPARASTCPRSTACRRSTTASDLLEQARQIDCRNVVVVGGGYIGLEMAEAFVRWGASVTLVEGSQQLMRTLRPRHGRARSPAPCAATASTCASASRAQAFEPGVVHTDAGAHRRRPRRARPRRRAQQPSWPPTPASSSACASAIRVDRRQRTSADGV